MPTEGTTLLNSKGGAPSASSPSLVERVKAEAATAAALLLSVLFFMMCSCSMLIVNKLALNALPLPFVVLTLQMGFAVVALCCAPCYLRFGSLQDVLRAEGGDGLRADTLRHMWRRSAAGDELRRERRAAGVVEMTLADATSHQSRRTRVSDASHNVQLPGRGPRGEVAFAHHRTRGGWGRLRRGAGRCHASTQVSSFSSQGGAVAAASE